MPGPSLERFSPDDIGFPQHWDKERRTDASLFDSGYLGRSTNSIRLIFAGIVHMDHRAGRQQAGYHRIPGYGIWHWGV